MCEAPLKKFNHYWGIFGHFYPIVKLRQGSGKDGQGIALKAKGLKP